MHALTSISEVYILGDSFVLFFFLTRPMFLLVLIFNSVNVCVCVILCGCENTLTCRCIIAIKAAGKVEIKSVFIFI